MVNPQSAGLYAGDRSVPLLGVAIHVEATGCASRVTVAQRYRNTEKVPLEAVYSFPLEEGSAVCGFEVCIDDKRICGQVEPRDEAFEQYDEAMAQGHGAFLLDQDRPNIFTASVGNLLPNQEAIVRLTYVAELSQHGKATRLMIPTTIAPRYLPQEQLRHIDPSELDHIAPPTVLGPVPYGLELRVDWSAAHAIDNISCPSHPATVKIDGTSAQVELMGESIQLDRDFVLEMSAVDPHEPSAIVAREADGTRVAMLNFFPDLSEGSRSSCEYVFLIDRSGSMRGTSIEQAKRALALCLRSLEPGDRFNIVGFGTHHESMFEESVPYDDANLEKASAAVAELDADLGGTELYRPLEFILRQQTTGPRQMVLLTDGQVGNEQACFDLISKHRGTRIFTFGVGHGASEHLVRGIARESRGQAEFIQPNERIEPKVLRQFRRMASPSLKNVRLDWHGMDTDFVAPFELPPVFDGDRLTVYGRISQGAADEVSIEADGPEGPVHFPVRVDLERAVENSAIPTLMARQGIRDIESDCDAAAVRGSRQESRKKKGKKERILELALRYQLMSSETSFVAIEQRDAAESTGQAELRRIPIALVKDWGGYAASIRGHHQLNMMDAQTAIGFADRPQMAALDGMPASLAAPRRSRLRAAYCGSMDKAIDIPEEESAGEDPFMGLIETQSAGGAFHVESATLALESLGIDSQQLETLSTQISGERSTALQIVVTLCAIHVLENEYSERQDEWRLVVDKARKWIEQQSVAPPEGSDSLDNWLSGVISIQR